jgi:hypothetical protein
VSVLRCHGQLASEWHPRSARKERAEAIRCHRARRLHPLASVRAPPSCRRTTHRRRARRWGPQAYLHSQESVLVVSLAVGPTRARTVNGLLTLKGRTHGSMEALRVPAQVRTNLHPSADEDTLQAQCRRPFPTPQLQVAHPTSGPPACFELGWRDQPRSALL